MNLVDFLRDYWQVIGTIVLITLEVVLLIIKRRPLSLDEFQSALDDTLKSIPHWCSVVESASNNPGEGSLKRQIVLQKCIDHIVYKLGRDLTDAEENKVLNASLTMIESTLSAPHKKGR